MAQAVVVEAQGIWSCCRLADCMIVADWPIALPQPIALARCISPHALPTPPCAAKVQEALLCNLPSILHTVCTSPSYAPHSSVLPAIDLTGKRKESPLLSRLTTRLANVLLAAAATLPAVLQLPDDRRPRGAPGALPLRWQAPWHLKSCSRQSSRYHMPARLCRR